MFLIKDRDFKSYKLVYEKEEGEFSNDLSASPENILTAENIRNESVGLCESSNSSSYRGYQQLFAGYISELYDLADKWTFEGLRAENSAQFIDDEVLIIKIRLFTCIKYYL